MMQVMLLTMPITFLGLPVHILWATGRLGNCFAGVLAGFSTFAGFSFLLHQLNFGILSVFVASIIGQAINIFVSYFFILKLSHREKVSDIQLPSEPIL
jgi:hypothetical protein